MRLIILITGIILSFNLKADWVSLGAGYGCNQNDGYFEIYSFVETSTPNKGEVYPDLSIELDRNLFKVGENKISCVLKKNKINSKFTVYSPSDRGEGSGSGRIDLNFVKVNNHILFKNTSFNSNSLILIKMRETKTGLKIYYCTATGWGWDVGHTGKKCFETTLNKMLTRHSS